MKGKEILKISHPCCVVEKYSACLKPVLGDCLLYLDARISVLIGVETSFAALLSILPFWRIRGDGSVVEGVKDVVAADMA